MEPGLLSRARSDDSAETLTSRKSSASSDSSPVKVVTRLRPLRQGERKQAIFPDWSSTREGEDNAAILEDESAQFNGYTKENQTPGFTTPNGKTTSSTGIIRPSASRIPSLSRARWMRPKNKQIPKSLIVESSHFSAGPSHSQARYFSYDAVLTEEVNQEKTYQHTVGNAIRRNLLRGYNTTICAYGQVGSGKTYTMYGPLRKDNEEVDETLNSCEDDDIAVEEKPSALHEEDGIVPRAMKDVFDSIADLTEDEVTLEMTILEIYRDELRDLLVPQGSPHLPLQLYDQHHEQNMVVVHGLKTIEVHTLSHASRLLRIAQRRRATSSTLNHESSRSHLICTLHVTISPAVPSSKTPSSPAAVLAATSARAQQLKFSTSSIPKLVSRLTLVDLAGSERLVHTPTNRANSEAITINKDLFVLGKVVAALASQPDGHVPYRDSKLTRILRDSLGGNCCTIFVACVSTAEINLEESLHTLRYAERARVITHTVRRNLVQSPLSARDASVLRAENQRLQAQLDQYSAGVQMTEFSSLMSKLLKAEQEAQRAREHAKSVRRTADKWKEQFEKIKVTREKIKLLYTSSNSEVNEISQRTLSVAQDNVDDDLDAILDDGSTRVEAPMHDSAVFDSRIAEMTEEMKSLSDEKVRLADQVAEMNEVLASQQAKMFALEDDYKFRQSEMSAHIGKQEKHRDQLDEEVELLKQKIHLLASNINQDRSTSISSVFRGLAKDDEKQNPNEVEMQTWRMETTSAPNVQVIEDLKELKQLLKSKEIECEDLRVTVNKLSVENLELKEENARLRAELENDKANGTSARKYSGDESLASATHTIGTTGSNDLFISNLNEMMKKGVCLYELSPLATKSRQIEFYLPSLKVFCPCGKHSVTKHNSEDPTALESILRPWQLEFLRSTGITRTIHLLQASRNRASQVAKQMRKWRRKKSMDLFHTASCAVALHIWSRTCIRVLKSVHQQKAQGRTKPVLPDFMEYRLDADLYTVSSMGQFSLRTYSEDEGTKSSSKVLFGVPETRATDLTKGREEKLQRELAAKLNAISVPKDEEILTIFQEVDRNEDGALSMPEVEKAILQRKDQFDIKPAIVLRAFQQADNDGDGSISRDEFYSFVRCITIFKNLWNIFSTMDTTGECQLNLNEFLQAAAALKIENPEELFVEMDENQSGYVTFDEFCLWVAEKRTESNLFDRVAI